MEHPIFSMRGEKVALGPLRRDLVALYTRWMNDFGMLRTLSMTPQPLTLESEIAWFEQTARSTTDAVFLMYERSSEAPIGVCGLHGIDDHHGTASLGIYIAVEGLRGRGYGTEAVELLLRYGFVERGLENIWLHVYDTNPGAVRSYEKAGFREIGRRRLAHRTARSRHDVIFMDALAEEWLSTHGQERPS